MVLAGSGTQFDPEVVACFVERFDELLAIYHTNQDNSGASDESATDETGSDTASATTAGA